MKKELGKITAASYGVGGYQDAMIGLHLQFGGEAWGCETSDSYWATKRSEHAKWTEEDRIKFLGELAMRIADLLSKAKVSNVSALVGIPVEVEFEDFRFKSFRVLTEVL